MKRGSAPLLALLIILVLISPLLISMSFAKTATPIPTNSEPVYPPQDMGTIVNTTGIVYDASGNPIPNAKVTLYSVVYIDGELKAREPATSPQLTGDGVSAAIGQYLFTGVPSGRYMITAEKGGISISQVIYTGGTAPNDIFIQGYVENGASPSPGTIVTEGPTYRPPPTATAHVPTQDIGTILSEIFRLSLMAIIGVQFIASIAIMALGFGKR